MRKIISILLSMPMMAIILLFLGLSLAIATFIENDYGAEAAKAVVYNSWWINAIMIYLGIILINNIFKKKLFTWRKFPLFLFHFSFLLILIGAGITRFISHEGIMHLREGEISHTYLSDNTYIKLSIENEGNTNQLEWKVLLSELNPRAFNENVQLADGILDIQSISLTDGAKGGLDVLELVLVWKGKRQSIFLKGAQGHLGIPLRVNLNDGKQIQIAYGSIAKNLAFSLRLNKFVIERYPGSNSPSSFKSEVSVIDQGKTFDREIYMNHVLDFGSYRFFQASFDQDEKGSILSVNQDKWGTGVSYLGYALMVLGMAWSWIASLFRQKPKLSQIMGISLLLSLSIYQSPTMAIGQQQKALQENQLDMSDMEIPKQQAENLGSLWVQDLNGRIKPVNTFSHEILRKISGKSSWYNMTADQVILSAMAHPSKWQHLPIIKIKNEHLAKELGIVGKYASYADFFYPTTLAYKLKLKVENAFQMLPALRGKYEQEVMKADERLNIFHLLIEGELLRLYPDPDSSNLKWHTIHTKANGVSREDSLFIAASFPYYLSLIREKSYSNADEILDGINLFQKRYGSSILPDNDKLRSEISYNKSQIFQQLSLVYGIVGIIFLLFIMIRIFRNQRISRLGFLFFNGILWVTFIIHTIGLIWRWYISGHAPWSDGFESMIYIAWVIMLAGLSFAGKSGLSSAGTAFLAAIVLSVAHLSWMDPAITPLVPVLQSYWLTIHVSIIISSYGFLALSALLGFLTMILMIGKTNAMRNGIINHVAYINRRSMKLGLYLLTIGTFLGGVWANESWGRYWGWDPKETWALITVLLYAFIIHLKYIPKASTRWNFSFLSWIAFSSVLMTYFGVNFYLSGLHSYASGDPIPIPSEIYYLIGITFVLGGVSKWFEHRSIHN